MLLSDRIYKQVPRFWILIGVLFLFFGLSAGPDIEFYPAYVSLGVLCVTRSIWIYQARWRHHKRNELRMTQAIHVKRRTTPD